MSPPDDAALESDRISPRYRTHGRPPYSVVLLHGGPGAWGEMSPLAQMILPEFSSLELFQIQPTLGGQLEEILATIREAAHRPVILVGFSWGAWLAYLFAAKFGETAGVAKVILVGSGPYEQEYFAQLQATRLGRMDADQREFYQLFFDRLDGLPPDEQERQIQVLGRLCEQVDHVDPMTDKELYQIVPRDDPPTFPVNRASFFSEAMETVMNYRKTGRLTEYAAQISCPVVAIHGDYDPHPAEGVLTPLRSKIPDFTMEILPRCGHKPWIERHAREPFLTLLKQYLHA